MIETACETTGQPTMTVDELCDLARSLGERNTRNERHWLASLRLPAPELCPDALERIRRDARAAGLDCYLDRGWLVLEPDPAAVAEQEFFELQEQLGAVHNHIAAMPWLRQLRESGVAYRDRLLHRARVLSLGSSAQATSARHPTPIKEYAMLDLVMVAITIG